MSRGAAPEPPEPRKSSSSPDLPPTPRWVRWAMRHLLSEDERRVVFAELAELHALWLKRAGRREADRRYLRQLRRYPLLLLAHTVRASARAPIPGLRDVTQAGRSLLRSPGLTATIALTVGIGIAGCTTIFAVVDALYLRPLPYTHADRLQVIYSQEGTNRWALSAVDVLALREQATDFSQIAASARSTRTFTAGGSAEVLDTYAVSPNFFDVLGVPLLSGRAPGKADATPGAPATALVTLGFAHSRLGSTRADGSDVVGRTLALDGAPCVVLGVLPSDVGPVARGARVFTTLQIAPPTRKGPFFMFAVGRLSDRVTPATARKQLHAITRRLFPLWQTSFQNEKATWGMEPLAESLQGNVSRLLAILMGAGLLVLLVAVANTAGLLVARMTSRSTELAVRSALGASAARVAGHLLTESTLLAVGGGLVGLAGARVGIAVLPAIASGYLPRLDELSLSGPVLTFALALAAGSGLVFGLLPVLRRRPDRHLASTLRTGGRGAVGDHEGRRVQRMLVAAQLAVSVPLLAGAGLLLSSFANLQRVDPGFDTGRLASVRISLPDGKYPRGDDRERFWKDALQKVSALPGVASVALSDSRPPDDHPVDNNFDLEDHPSPAGSQPVVPWVFADTGFFHTLDIPLLEGRLFDAQDTDAANPVVIVDEAWAKRFFPGQSAVGRRMHNGGDTSGPLTTVVGVVGDVPWSGLAKRDQGVVYDPNIERWATTAFLYVRTRGTPMPVIASVRAAIRDLDPGVPVTEASTARQAIRASLSHPRNLTLLISVFSAVALALAVLGLYGVTTYGVQQRRGDIAVRLTLGGSPRAVLGSVVRESMTLAAAGLVVGVVASLLLTRALSSILYGVDARDPTALVGAALVLLTVSALACLVPGLRAVRVNPAHTLREE